MPQENENAGGGNPGGNNGGNNADNANVNKDVQNPGGGNADPNKGGNTDPNAGKGGADPNAGKTGGDGQADPNKKVDAPADPAAGDWRTKYAGGDETRLNVLKRYPSEKEFAEAFFHGRTELQKAMSSQPPGKDATPEQVTAWRKTNGIPEKAEGYLEKLPKGVVFGEADKPVIMGYLEAALARGDKPEVVAQNLEIYHKASDAMITQVLERDNTAKTNLETTMKEQWGGEYTQNMTTFKNFIGQAFPKEIEQALMNARMGDEAATPLMLSPPFVKAMVQLAHELNPAGINTGGTGMDNIQTIEDGIKEYENGLNGKPRIGSKTWYKDEASQKKYRDLVSARERFAGKKKTG